MRGVLQEALKSMLPALSERPQPKDRSGWWRY